MYYLEHDVDVLKKYMHTSVTKHILVKGCSQSLSQHDFKMHCRTSLELQLVCRQRHDTLHRHSPASQFRKCDADSLLASLG
jgi:hypothetical protein